MRRHFFLPLSLCLPLVAVDEGLVVVCEEGDYVGCESTIC